VEKTRRVLIAMTVRFPPRPESRADLRPEIVIVGEAMDGEEAVRLVAALRPM